MMNKNILLITMLLGSLAPQAQASFYVGAGVGYQYMNIDSVRSLEEVTLAGDPNYIVFNLPVIYADEFSGFSFLSGYRFKKSPWAIELNYFKSSVSKSKPLGFSASMPNFSSVTETQVESFSVDAIGYYTLNNFNKLTLLGSVGVLHQNTSIVGEFTERVFGGGINLEPGDDGYNYYSTGRAKKNIYDTRLKLGVGMEYSISEAISTRAIFSVIPGGFSMTEGTPYSVNASLLYHF